MKRLMMALCALMISGMSHAAIDTLLVRFAPTASVYTVDDWVYATANTNHDGAEYRFALERLESGQYVSVEDTGWSLTRDFVVNHRNGLSAGKYRLQTYAREAEGLPEFLTSKVFRVIGRENSDFDRISTMNDIRRTFEAVVFAVRSEMARARKKLALEIDVSDEFNNLSLVVTDANAGLLDDWETDNSPIAPGGGAKVIYGGTPGDGDATGAIVVEAIQPPQDLGNWAGTTLTVTLPAYPAVNGLTRKTETIRWED